MREIAQKKATFSLKSTLAKVSGSHCQSQLLFQVIICGRSLDITVGWRTKVTYMFSTGWKKLGGILSIYIM